MRCARSATRSSGADRSKIARDATARSRRMAHVRVVPAESPAAVDHAASSHAETERRQSRAPHADVQAVPQAGACDVLEHGPGARLPGRRIAARRAVASAFSQVDPKAESRSQLRHAAVARSSASGAKALLIVILRRDRDSFQRGCRDRARARRWRRRDPSPTA